MTAVDHAELKRLAEGATPGPWNNSGRSVDDFDAECMMRMEWIANGAADDDDDLNANVENDAAFIAAANPAVVLELLSEIEGLKAANKDHCRAVNTLTLEAVEFERQIADLRASAAKTNSGFEEYERKFYLASDDVDRLKLAICGGEDAPGAINAVSVEDCERFIAEERGRHIDTEARLEYVRASRDGAAGRTHDLYMALAEVKEQVVTYPLSDNSTCMCGAPLGGHNVGSGHAPVSLADHAISLIVEGIDKALRFGAPTDGRPDDYEGPDVGMHDTEIVERDDD